MSITGIKVYAVQNCGMLVNILGLVYSIGRTFVVDVDSRLLPLYCVLPLGCLHVPRWHFVLCYTCVLYTNNWVEFVELSAIFRNNKTLATSAMFFSQLGFVTAKAFVCVKTPEIHVDSRSLPLHCVFPLCCLHVARWHFVLCYTCVLHTNNWMEFFEFSAALF